MGPGIFTRYSKQVIGALLTLLVLFAAVALVYRLRGPVGGKSPYETVNDLYEWEYMTFESLQGTYPANTEYVELYFRNDAPDGVVILSAGGSPSFGYELEVWSNGNWHQMRSSNKICRWEGRTGESRFWPAPWGGIIPLLWQRGAIALCCRTASMYSEPKCRWQRNLR